MRPKHEYARYSIRYHIPLIVNKSSHQNINKIDTHSLQGFSKYIKIKILESYNKNSTIQNNSICNRNLQTLCMFVIYPLYHIHTPCINICFL